MQSHFVVVLEEISHWAGKIIRSTKHEAMYCFGLMVYHCFLSLLTDEEEVGPWPRGPIFPFRKKAL